ncbi:ty3-gypsy retrotransposon protein [Cucumis melo var. makuwa]|uniref:Ty3-gypsy retrotransposon protein n=1 Tax=Cucumis melo var. makuwa TaxID=1194695 RepID=A0A5A7T7D3_CUCMM|nr:ty3-gypsy retrotransposon protein [Cucumis melo var. makuwa]TYK26952.1 ty3-gypsy retrotransposon protein [Cucumis melo var. makuwa]
MQRKRTEGTENVVTEDNQEEEIIEEDEYGLKELNVIEIKEEVKATVDLSINSVVGLSNPRTMKVKVKIKGEEVVVLIDWGSTHNFISKKVVAALKLPRKEISNYGVILGSRTTIKGKGVCEAVELVLNEWRVVENFIPPELGGVDVILGIQWHYSLRVTEMDWRNLTMTFFHENNKVVTKGDPSLTKTRVSLKSMIKTWTDYD